MREILLSEITAAVKEMTIRANNNLNPDVHKYLEEAQKEEASPIGKQIISQLLENANIAESKQVPMCQDTGLAVFFVEVGENLRWNNDMTGNENIIEGTLSEALNEGVRQGYTAGYLRKSIVRDPFDRVNTQDNTPAIIHYDLVAGDKLHIDFSPKGIGSENMSRIFMLKPSEGIEGVKRVVLETIENAGPNACPPMIVGVGVGGTFEKAAILAKKALLRPLDEPNSDEHLQVIEKEIKNKANTLGIGPQGMGGTTTVLKINMLTYATHIAGLPVAVNISCHATRHAEVTL